MDGSAGMCSLSQEAPRGKAEWSTSLRSKGKCRACPLSLPLSLYLFFILGPLLLFPHAPPSQHFSHSVDQGVGVYPSHAPVKPQHAVIKVKSCK